ENKSQSSSSGGTSSDSGRVTGGIFDGGGRSGRGEKYRRGDGRRSGRRTGADQAARGSVGSAARGDALQSRPSGPPPCGGGRNSHNDSTDIDRRESSSFPTAGENEARNASMVATATQTRPPTPPPARDEYLSSVSGSVPPPQKFPTPSPSPATYETSWTSSSSPALSSIYEPQAP
ncbi:unnamed protein product, partial [Sphacelaria rigidula]